MNIFKSLFEVIMLCIYVERMSEYPHQDILPVTSLKTGEIHDD